MSTLITVESPVGIFVAPQGDLITGQLLRHGAHAGAELGLLGTVLGKGDVVIDIGAHIGTFAVPLARVVGVDGIVVCFEPWPSSYDLLDLNVELNGLGRIVVTRRIAMGDRPGRFRVAAVDEENTGAAHLEADDDGPVAAVTLDGWMSRNPWLDRLDLLKIDTEGMELAVLTGAAATLEKHSPMVYAEIAEEQLARAGATSAQIESVLRDRGYRLFRNVGERHGWDSQFRLVEIPSLSAEELFDVLAVPDAHLHRVAPLVAA